MSLSQCAARALLSADRNKSVNVTRLKSSVGSGHSRVSSRLLDQVKRNSEAANTADYEEAQHNVADLDSCLIESTSRTQGITMIAAAKIAKRVSETRPVKADMHAIAVAHEKNKSLALQQLGYIEKEMQLIKQTAVERQELLASKKEQDLRLLDQMLKAQKDFELAQKESERQMARKDSE